MKERKLGKYKRAESSKKDLLRMVRKLFKENLRLKAKLRPIASFRKALLEESEDW